MHALALRFRNTALAAAITLGSFAFPALAQDGGELVGHWLKTTIVFESPRDEHLVLSPDGSFQNWRETVSGSSEPLVGQWVSNETTLTFKIEGSEDQFSPYTFLEGQLVYPNVEGNRGFWERVE